ncbi:peptide synthetase [Hahella sp. KA22]|nr:peptide synthetase [Hahella sp. KA22]QAY54463.1 peptide synthetase [Hahella sp. KA22]
MNFTASVIQKSELSQSIQKFRLEPLQGLSPKDQIKFIQYGQGEYKKPPFSNIYLAIEQSMKTYADKTAVEHMGDKISYGELQKQVDFLAGVLISAGVKKGDHVALFVRRSIPMVVGVLATLKVGAAYVPQDVKICPKEQLKLVAQSSAARVMLTLSEYHDSVPIPPDCERLCIDEILSRRTLADSAPVPPSFPTVEEDDACFVLFTSGTTGAPNGVKVTHGNVCNLLLTAPGNLGIQPGEKVAQILNIAFDMAAWEILTTLAHGGELIIRGCGFQETVSRANVVIATPSILSKLDPAACPDLRAVAVAGEACPEPLARKWATHCEFYNCCGPTEVTIVNTMGRYLPDQGQLSIGAPTPNNTVYILNDSLKPCAIGEVGEMWAGGACVTAGYINNDVLNEDRYRHDPFLDNGGKMFRTRDLGRWLENGELEHLGRTDDQVKVRGFRVELNSVSCAIEALPGCQQAVVIKHTSRDLAAFVKPASVNPVQVKQAVAAKLPYYCIPDKVIALDEFPMTPRGKVDKKRLEEMLANIPASQEVPA